MTDPDELASQHIYSKLKVNQDILDFVGRHPVSKKIQIYDMIAPQDAVYPFIIIRYMTGDSRRGVGGTVSMWNTEYRVYACIQGDSYAKLNPIAKLIGELVHKTQELGTEQTIGASVIAPYKHEDTVSGKRTLYKGHIFHVAIQG